MSDSAKTNCFAWIVIRLDGEKLGFTDHDKTLTIDGVECEPDSGFNASALEASAGLSADTNEVEGALKSDRITNEDINAKLYHGARIVQYWLDWKAPENATVIRQHYIGEITVDDNAFRVELRSYSTKLDQQHGRIYKRSCDADFGDARCGIDTSLSPWYGSGSVNDDSRNSAQFIIGTIDHDFDANWFANGKIIFESGSLTGQTGIIASTSRCKSGGEISSTLLQALPAMPAKGDAFKIIAGCDKSFPTCKAKFDNAVCFRGFPHMPGNDKALTYADGETVFDGAPLVD